MAELLHLPAGHPRPGPPLADLAGPPLSAQGHSGPKRSVRALYLVQLLSTWAMRISDFSLILFLTDAIPGTLLYISIYGLTKALVAVLLSSWVAQSTRRLSRLHALQLAIACQRISVAASCFLFSLFPLFGAHPRLRDSLFAVLTCFGCVEKLASITSVVIIERDWVIVIAEAGSIPRHGLNAQLRRIELFSKLLPPLIISFFNSRSPQIAIWAVLFSNLGSMLVEFRVTSQMWSSVPGLAHSPSSATDEGIVIEGGPHHVSAAFGSTYDTGQGQWLSNVIQPWREYARSPAFFASFSNGVLYWTVLFFGGQTITYLLTTGFTPFEVASLRVASTIAETLRTVISPPIMAKLGPGLAGVCFMGWQLICIGVFAGRILAADMVTKGSGILLAIGITLKRIGLCGSDLAIQFIVQETVPASSRAQFSSTEMACQNLFELLSYCTTTIYFRAEDFKYPVFISYGGIIASTIFYSTYAWQTRRTYSYLTLAQEPSGGI
uniref:Solute carrier family 40 member n=1 Tax=Bionectria ochroleuca TaxID=29856 RepID=A0A8H7KDG2_BIOOC